VVGPAFTSQVVPRQEGNVVLGLIFSIIVIGLIAGALARPIVPGRQDLSIMMTIVLGIVGSFVGGDRAPHKMEPVGRLGKSSHRRVCLISDLRGFQGMLSG
jgi:hypothetical protein